MSYESAVFSGYPQDRIWAISGLKNLSGALRVGKSSTINSAFWVFLFLVGKAKNLANCGIYCRENIKNELFFRIFELANCLFWVLWIPRKNFMLISRFKAEENFIVLLLWCGLFSKSEVSYCFCLQNVVRVRIWPFF